MNYPSRRPELKPVGHPILVRLNAGAYNGQLHFRGVERKVPPLLTGATRPMNPIPLTGSAKPVCAANAPLLWVLRDNLGFAGTGFGYGQNLCSAEVGSR